MKKTIKHFFYTFCILIALLWIGIWVVNRMLLSQLPILLEQASSPFMQISVDKVERLDGFFMVGANVSGITLTFPNQKVVRIKDIRMKIPFKWPIRLNIQAQDPIKADVTLGKQAWQIRRLTGEILDLAFDIQGDIDIAANQGELLFRTRGLRRFLMNFTEVPGWLNFLIRDEDQSLTLTPQNGFLTLYGLPLFSLKF